MPNTTTPESFQKWDSPDLELSNKFLASKNNVHIALCGQYFVTKSKHKSS